MYCQVKQDMPSKDRSCAIIGILRKCKVSPIVKTEKWTVYGALVWQNWTGAISGKAAL